MKHNIKHKKLNRTSSHMKALLKNMSDSLIAHASINTTLPKAKNLKPYLEKLITKARTNNIHVKKQLAKKVNNDQSISRLFEIAKIYNDTPGGYLRIIKLSPRYGDNAPMANIRFVKNIKKLSTIKDSNN